ncbi:MAG: hypothetical protein A2V86_17190 [Deltaproteobacteria bacterium RBG_16_49_23]|nr:MAG: hypothetical protein A2V86_17190 [Deltaproteobacteria bacterium RBG_16_49_23]
MKTAVLFILFLLLTWNSLSEGATPLQSLIPQKDLPEGWILIDGPQVYTKKTLFERINGQADLFFKYGFQKSVFAVYQNRKDKENQVELDIYDMGSVLHAFGIFSRFRNGDRPGGVGLDSYFEDRSGFFYQGKYFVMLYGPESNPGLLGDWSQFISKKIPDRSLPPREIGFFPKDGLKPGSIQYFPEGLLGRKFLGRGFQGTYTDKVEVEGKVKDKNKAKTEDKEFKFFVAIFKNSQEAINALKHYGGDLANKGKVYQFESNTLRGEDDYRGEVLVVQRGTHLLGAIGFGKEETKIRMAEFMKNIK